jgi:hypothetical protein
MIPSNRLWTLLIALAVAAPVAAWPEPTSEELAANRRRFEQVRKSPEQLAKLRDEAKEFFALPEPRREQIARLEASMRAQPIGVQQRLREVLERYSDWLAGLKNDATRQKIIDAKDPKTRLALIRRLRDQEWIDEQPKAVRAELEKLKDDALQKRMAELKLEERQRKLEWLMATRFWNDLESKRPLPVKSADLPKDAQLYLNQYLLWFLSDAEKDRLAKAEGQWPLYPMTLVELADKHPAALPGPTGPKNMNELPLDVKQVLAKGPPLKKLFKFEGKWPEFGTRIAKAAFGAGLVLPHEFLAYNVDCLQPAMREFYKKKLYPALSSDEKNRLTEEALHKWPDFPRAIQELSAQHGLKPPWHTLPRNETWDNYRLSKRGP